MEDRLSCSLFYQKVTGNVPCLNGKPTRHIGRVLYDSDMDPIISYANLLGKENFGAHVKKLKEYSSKGDIESFNSELENLLEHICISD